MMIAIVLAAAACSAEASIVDTDSTTAGSAAADTQAPGTSTESAPAQPAPSSNEAQGAAAVAAPQQATIPNAICGNGELVEGVLDLDFMAANGLIGPDTSWVSGSDFDADKWNDTRIQDCGVSLINGDWLSITVANGSGSLGAEFESTETIGGASVDFLASGRVITARVTYDDPSSETGDSALLFSLSNRPQGADPVAAQAVLRTIIERVMPNVSFVSPAVAETEVDPYDEWKATMLVQWVAECEGGDLDSCDFLWYTSKRDSPEELAALTCGGTREASANSRCMGWTDIGEPETEGDHPLLDEYTGECRAGDELGCRKLYALVSGASAYYDFADDCLSEIRNEPGPCSVEMFASGNDS